MFKIIKNSSSCIESETMQWFSTVSTKAVLFQAIGFGEIQRGHE